MLFGTGIALAPFDDTMLISYVLDASSSLEGTAWTSCPSASSATSRSATASSSAPARRQGHRRLSDRQGDGIRRRGRRRDAAPLAGAQARLAAEGMVSVYERLERPLVPVLARMEERGIRADRQILSVFGSVRPEGGRPRGRHSTSSPASRSTSAPRSSSAKSSSASSGFPGQEDQDRAMGDRRQASRRPRRPGS